MRATSRVFFWRLPPGNEDEAIGSGASRPGSGRSRQIDAPAQGAAGGIERECPGSPEVTSSRRRRSSLRQRSPCLRRPVRNAPASACDRSLGRWQRVRGRSERRRCPARQRPGRTEPGSGTASARGRCAGRGRRPRQTRRSGCARTLRTPSRRDRPRRRRPLAP